MRRAPTTPQSMGLAPHPVAVLLMLAIGLVSFAPEGLAARSGKDQDAKKATRVKAEDLKRVEVPRGGEFPWVAEEAKLGHKPKPSKKGDDSEEEQLEIAGSDLVIQGFGKFSMATTGSGEEQKQEIILNKKVAIESAQSNFVLRGERIRAVLSSASGNLEFVEAEGEVQFVLDDLKARGKYLRYDMQAVGKRKRLREQVVIVGSKEDRRPATLWSGDNAIQSFKFILDLRLNLYRAQGGALAIVHLPEDKKKTEKPASPAIPLPRIDLSGGGALELACDGDLQLEGATGMVRIARNVFIKKGPLVIRADEVSVQLGGPDAPGGAGGALFAGQFRSFACDGKIEIFTSDFVVHCDHITNDLAREIVRLEMDDPRSEVRMYRRNRKNRNQTSMYLRARHRISMHPKTQAILDRIDDDPTAPAAAMATKRLLKPMDIPRLRPERLPRLKQLNTKPPSKK